MAIVLKADNRTLVNNTTEYSYLTKNYASGVSTIQVATTEPFTADDFILLGEFGQETTEIFRIGSVNSSTDELTLETAAGSSTSTISPHSESTKVTVIPYNQIRFFFTAALGTIDDETPTYDTNNPLTGWTSVTPTMLYSIYSDTANSTGFGWVVFRNSITEVSSQQSNPIPYADFTTNTVASVFADFDSLMNTNELKLITIADKLSWINEALALLKNKLNLSNTSYTVSSETSISIVADTAEYELTSDFSNIVYIHNGTNNKIPIPFMPINKAGSYTGDVTHYYLRGRYIGFVPTPDEATTYKYRYQAKTTRVTSVSTYINLPDDAYYALKSFMLYRAHLKMKSALAGTYLEEFSNMVSMYIEASHKRNNSLDSWDIESSSNN